MSNGVLITTADGGPTAPTERGTGAMAHLIAGDGLVGWIIPRQRHFSCIRSRLGGEAGGRG